MQCRVRNLGLHAMQSPEPRVACNAEYGTSRCIQCRVRDLGLHAMQRTGPQVACNAENGTSGCIQCRIGRSGAVEYISRGLTFSRSIRPRIETALADAEGGRSSSNSNSQSLGPQSLRLRLPLQACHAHHVHQGPSRCADRARRGAGGRAHAQQVLEAPML